MKTPKNKAFIVILALLVSGLFGFAGTDVFAATGPVSTSLSANNQNINKGENVTLSWNSTNAEFCVAHSNLQNWFGSRNISGSQLVTPTETATYYITCSNSGGFSATAQTRVSVGESQASNVSVNLSANPESIFRGESTALIWNSSNAVSCEASGYWSGLKAPSGSERVSPSVTVSYTLRCNNSAGQYTSDTQFVFVNPATPLPTAFVAPKPVSTPLIPSPTIKPAVTTVRIVKLSAPTNLKPNGDQLPSDTKKVTLSWDAVKGTKFYAVRLDPKVKTDSRDERNNCPNNPHYLCVDKLESTSIKVKIEPGQNYDWWVHAVDSNGVFGNSGSAKFSVEAKETTDIGAFLANIFSGIGGNVFILGLAGLIFIFGYLWGRKRGREQAEFIRESRLPQLPQFPQLK